MFGWLVRAHTQHLLDEVQYLRDELRFERDRNARLQESFLTLRVGAPVYATAPSIPRESDAEKGRAAMEEAARMVDDLGVGAVPTL